jgi:hypothetical protein
MMQGHLTILKRLIRLRRHGPRLRFLLLLLRFLFLFLHVAYLSDLIFGFIIIHGLNDLIVPLLLRVILGEGVNTVIPA